MVAGKVERQSVDLSGYPDLIVIHLGFRVASLRGLGSLFRISRGLNALVADKPDGLLAHEYMMFGLLHLGFRQYWRDLASLERFTKSGQHAAWWRDFGKDTGGAGFWHETYALKGGMEAVYLNMPSAPGFGRFAPAKAPRGPFLTARERLGRAEAA